MILCLYLCIALLLLGIELESHWLIILSSVCFLISEVRYYQLKCRIDDLEKENKK